MFCYSGCYFSCAPTPCAFCTGCLPASGPSELWSSSAHAPEYALEYGLEYGLVRPTVWGSLDCGLQNGLERWSTVWSTWARTQFWITVWNALWNLAWGVWGLWSTPWSACVEFIIIVDYCMECSLEFGLR